MSSEPPPSAGPSETSPGANNASQAQLSAPSGSPKLAPSPRITPLSPTSPTSDLQIRPKATTAVSSVDIQTLSFPDGSRGTFSTFRQSPSATHTPFRSGAASPVAYVDNDDNVSVASYAPTTRPAADLASLIGNELNRKSPAWNLLRMQAPSVPPFETVNLEETDRLENFATEFDEVPEADEDEDEEAAAATDERRMKLWQGKLKHYMILSSAGKPVYSRHGDLSLVNGFMGVVQTIISFYEGSNDPLMGFTAGDTRFVIYIRGPLYFVAISRLGESDSQLRSQLEALYMQILSTLTLPGLNKHFAHRPSTDLRKPLQGTGPLLSSLADNFTLGSPSALLGALECLKIRKAHRLSINNTFLKLRTDKLLYGLIVAGGRLVSVIRPRRHSLHPSDLHLIFNMFHAGRVQAGEGEKWIPLCLPAFNNKGHLHMYVSFVDADGGASVPSSAVSSPVAGPFSPRSTNSSSEGRPVTTSSEEDVAVVLISADRESFFEMNEMRNEVIGQLSKNGSLDIIKKAAKLGRPQVQDIVPGSPVSHFLYKSKDNVQFVMSSLEPAFGDWLKRRRLMTLYHQLHKSAHAKYAHVKVLFATSSEATALAWITANFEFYCVAGPNVSRASITQAANKIYQWVRREEERLFIIGGGVF